MTQVQRLLKREPGKGVAQDRDDFIAQHEPTMFSRQQLGLKAA